MELFTLFLFIFYKQSSLETVSLAVVFEKDWGLIFSVLFLFNFDKLFFLLIFDLFYKDNILLKVFLNC